MTLLLVYITKQSMVSCYIRNSDGFIILIITVNKRIAHLAIRGA